MSDRSGPLAGIVVLDLATAFAAPYGGAILADLGARVIKVERPDGGDITRQGDDSLGGQSGYFVGVNHGKEGLALDLKLPAAQAAVRRMVPRVDVLIENFRPGLMDRWGLGFEALRSLRPDLIYCSLSAYGEAASLAGRTGNDMTMQAYAGLMDLTGDSAGPPQRAGVPVVDAAGGFNTAIAVLGALYRRQSSGEGDHIEVNLLQAAYSLMPNLTATVLNSEADYHRLGTWHPQFAPCEVFRCGDGQYLSLCAIHDRPWRGLCEAIGRPELQSDERFLDNFARVRNRRLLREVLEAELAKAPRNAWVTRLEAADVTVAPLLSLRESVDRFRAEVPDLCWQLPHAELGTLAVMQPAYRFREHAVEPPRTAAPLLGEDTERILAEFGFAPDEIADLLSAGAAFAHDERPEPTKQTDG